VVSGEGTYTLVYAFTDVNGCVGTDDQVMVVNAIPELYDIEIEDANCGKGDGSITLVPYDANADYTVSWSHSSDITGLTAENLDKDNYEVLISNADGCAITELINLDCIEIRIPRDGIFMPNVFKPNDDGRNDML